MHLTSRSFSFLGGPKLRTVLVALASIALLVRHRASSAVMLVAATGGMGVINTAIKLVVRRRRPQASVGGAQASGYSFPSGHSSGSFVFFGSLGYLIWREARHGALALLGFGAAFAVIVMVGRSRVRLRAHYISDVLGGYALGAVWLAVVIRVFGHRLDGEER